MEEEEDKDEEEEGGKEEVVGATAKEAEADEFTGRVAAWRRDGVLWAVGGEGEAGVDKDERDREGVTDGEAEKTETTGELTPAETSEA